MRPLLATASAVDRHFGDALSDHPGRAFWGGFPVIEGGPDWL